MYILCLNDPVFVNDIVESITMVSNSLNEFTSAYMRIADYLFGILDLQILITPLVS
jgi:hypothetical protein